MPVVFQSHKRVISKVEEKRSFVSSYTFANLYDRDSTGLDKPAGIRMFIKMNAVGPMNVKIHRADISRSGGEWRKCNFGKMAYNGGLERPRDYTLIEPNLRYPNYFDALILCPAETVPADRSRGYSGLDPLRKGTYRLRVAFEVNGKNYAHEVEMRLNRELKAGVITILDVLAPWTAGDWG